jgi:cytochrome c biogenesis protein CcdA
MLQLGFLLGMKHSTEADHLAAVATLATRQSTLAQSVQQGVAWGVGHTLTLVIIGSAVLLLGKTIPPHVVQWLELAVGVMLVVLGVDVVRRLARNRIHFHVHTHDGGIRHLHAHGHAQTPPVGLLQRPAQRHLLPRHHLVHLRDPLPRHRLVQPRHVSARHRLLHPSQLSPRHRHVHSPHLPLRALAIGIMHGMAGSAALILLSLEAVHSFPLGMLYILLFGAGSIVGMALLSFAIAIPLRVSSLGMERLHRGLTLLVGAASAGLGLYMVYEIGLAGRLLLA